MSAPIRVLVASDAEADAELVAKRLETDFSPVEISKNADEAVADFERGRPEVMILAFDEVERAQSWYLNLYRHSALIHAIPHRTILLCHKDHLLSAYEECKRETFDDYVLFWPMAQDGYRLPLSIYHAARLVRLAASGPTPGEFAVHARRLALNNQGFDENAPLGSERAQALKSLTGLAERVKSSVLVVEDDERQQKLWQAMLSGLGCDLMFANTGVGALASLWRKRPDLIVMDVGLRDMDGVAATRKIKAIDRFITIPIIMVSDQSSRDLVISCVQAGAAQFVVKPFNKERVIALVGQALGIGRDVVPSGM